MSKFIKFSWPVRKNRDTVTPVSLSAGGLRDVRPGPPSSSLEAVHAEKLCCHRLFCFSARSHFPQRLIVAILVPPSRNIPNRSLRCRRAPNTTTNDSGRVTIDRMNPSTPPRIYVRPLARFTSSFKTYIRLSASPWTGSPALSLYRQIRSRERLARYRPIWERSPSLGAVPTCWLFVRTRRCTTSSISERNPPYPT
jgi:hypothetical protein